MKRSFWVGERKRQACFSSLVGVQSSGKKFSSPKETAPDGKQSKIEHVEFVWYVLVYFWVTPERPSTETALLPIYTAKHLEHVGALLALWQEPPLLWQHMGVSGVESIWRIPHKTRRLH